MLQMSTIGMSGIAGIKFVQWIGFIFTLVPSEELANLCRSLVPRSHQNPRDGLTGRSRFRPYANSSSATIRALPMRFEHSGPIPDAIDSGTVRARPQRPQ
jgi:hypothetical protein